MTFARKAFQFLCWTYLVLLPVQFLIAGYGIMGGDIDAHMGFGIMVLGTLIPLLMLITVGIGRIGWKTAGLVVLLAAVLHLLPALPSQDNDWVAGLHPAIAMLSWPYVYFVLLRDARRALAETSQVIVAEPATTSA